MTNPNKIPSLLKLAALTKLVLKAPDKALNVHGIHIMGAATWRYSQHHLSTLTYRPASTVLAHFQLGTQREKYNHITKIEKSWKQA
jgi:hypothetical protein